MGVDPKLKRISEKLLKLAIKVREEESAEKAQKAKMQLSSLLSKITDDKILRAIWYGVPGRFYTGSELYGRLLLRDLIRQHMQHLGMINIP